MAVYTQLTREQIENFLLDYDCGALHGFEGIVQGVENTNYKIQTDRSRYILTVFEKRTNENDLPFFFSFMGHLRGRGIYCPFVVKTRDGLSIRRVMGKAAAIIGFLDGRNIDAAELTPALCREAGQLLARMHIAAADFGETRENSMSLPAWKEIFDKIKEVPVIPEQRMNSMDPGFHRDDGLVSLISSEISLAKTTLAMDLPRGVVHADFFPDNVFMKDGHVEGVIDFYFSATDYFVYDLAIAVNAFCFVDGVLDRALFDAMIAGYESLRPLSGPEKAAFQPMARAAALRILMTRTHDFIFHDPAALVKAKDPSEYQKILEHHRHDKLIG